MRVEQPNALAKRLLVDDPSWPADADGTVEFRPDVYGWDMALLKLLTEPDAK